MITYYSLEVRGRIETVDTFDNCIILLQERYGWVPLHVIDQVLKVKIEPSGIVNPRRWKK